MHLEQFFKVNVDTNGTVTPISVIKGNGVLLTDKITGTLNGYRVMATIKRAAKRTVTIGNFIHNLGNPYGPGYLHYYQVEYHSLCAALRACLNPAISYYPSIYRIAYGRHPLNYRQRSTYKLTHLADPINYGEVAKTPKTALPAKHRKVY